MTLTEATQFTQLVENYVSFVVDGMDIETLESLVYDLLVREYETYTQEQIIGEIHELYGHEFATEMVESVTAVPVA